VDGVAVDVSAISFLSGVAGCQGCGREGFQEAYEKGKPFLLEPMMEVEISVPEEFLGGVIGDINARRGHVVSVDRRLDISMLSATAPLKEMFGYVTMLRSLSQGRGNYTMKFSRYDRA
jgi:elongation factor G